MALAHVHGESVHDGQVRSADAVCMLSTGHVGFLP